MSGQTRAMTHDMTHEMPRSAEAACHVYVLGSLPVGARGTRAGKAGIRKAKTSKARICKPQTCKPQTCKTYVGWTLDLTRRLAQHNAGTGARSTRGRQWCLLYSESFATRNEAMSREWHLKRDRAFRKELARAFMARGSEQGGG